MCDSFALCCMFILYTFWPVIKHSDWFFCRFRPPKRLNEAQLCVLCVIWWDITHGYMNAMLNFIHTVYHFLQIPRYGTFNSNSNSVSLLILTLVCIYNISKILSNTFKNCLNSVNCLKFLDMSISTLNCLDFWPNVNWKWLKQQMSATPNHNDDKQAKQQNRKETKI